MTSPVELDNVLVSHTAVAEAGFALDGEIYGQEVGAAKRMGRSVKKNPRIGWAKRSQGSRCQRESGSPMSCQRLR